MDKYRVVGFQPDAVQKVTTQLTLAINSIHLAGIVHGDLKPENILIEETDGKIKLALTDFGHCGRVVINGQPVEARQTYPITGLQFMSRSQHKDLCLSKRDDWESFCYLVFSLNEALPWNGIEDHR